MLSVKNIEISGLSRISREDILFRSGFQKGCNILSVNLSALEKRLKIHPWIQKIHVERMFPSGIRISLKEHQPLAVLDTDIKMTLNLQGRLFKKWDPSDPAPLPLVTGISMKEITDARNVPDSPFHAVMDVLLLSRLPGSIIPNEQIKTIQSDPELGITLQLVPGARFFQMKKLILGYGQYKEKYERFKMLLQYLKTVSQHQDVRITTVDLNNPNHIVMMPMIEETFAENKKEEV